jgi:hypothetical protein
MSADVELVSLLRHKVPTSAICRHYRSESAQEEENHLQSIAPAALRQLSTATTEATVLGRRFTYILFRQQHYVSHLTPLQKRACSEG